MTNNNRREQTRYARSSTTSLGSLSNGNRQVRKRHGLRNMKIPFFEEYLLKASLQIPVDTSGEIR